MPPTDTPPQYISALNILAANPLQNWQTKSLAGNWDAVQKGNFGALSFTGQTPLAASYGLLQIGYITAVDPNTMGWNGVDGAQNPSYLFDADADIVGEGGGSLALGTGYLAGRMFYPCGNPTLSPSSPAFASPPDFAQAFVRALNCYNHGHTKGAYGRAIVSGPAYSPAYMPVPSSPIFADN